MNKTTLNSQKAKHSMLSLRRATSLGLLSLKPHTHFYPRSPCGERRLEVRDHRVQIVISIHALLAESDRRMGFLFCIKEISIHALLAESDYCGDKDSNVGNAFLSTLSLRRATFQCFQNHAAQRPISIHALLAESDLADAEYLQRTNISIHALLAESDDIMT